MDDTQHYDAILETYKKQEIPLEEKDKQFEKYLSEYQDEVKHLEKIRMDFENKYFQRNQKQLKLIENMQNTLNICEENGLMCEGVEQKQKHLCQSKIKMYNALENQKDVLQEVSYDLKRLDTERQLENVSTKIEDYRNKTKNIGEVVDKRCQEFQTLNVITKNTDYLVSPKMKEHYKKKDFIKSLIQINTEIGKVKKHIRIINLRAKELREQS